MFNYCHFRVLFILFLLPIICSAKNFQCEDMFPPSLQISRIDGCNSRYIKNFTAKKGKTLFDNQLFHALQNNNNLGGLRMDFPHHPKTVYRSAFLSTSPICIQALSPNISTVINLYSRDSGYPTELYELQRAIFMANGVKKHVQIKNYDYDAHIPPQQMYKKITAIIKKIQSAKGNVLIHCYAGQHDTGLIFAILNKCINKQPLESIKQNLICHMYNPSSELPYEKKAYGTIIKLIEQYPCSLLNQPA